MLNKGVLTKWSTCLLVSYPILNVIRTPISKFSIADIILLFLCICILAYCLYSNLNIKLLIEKIMLFFWSYILVHLIYNLVFMGTPILGDETLSTLRFLLYLGFLSFFCKYFFDIFLALKVLKFCAYSSSIYIIFQSLMSGLFNKYIPAGIPGLPVMREDMLTYIVDVKKYNLVYRPRSFFAEPAHFCQYVCLALAVDLMVCKHNKVSAYLYPIILSIGILLSVSSTGIILCAFIWLVWLIKVIKTKKNARNLAILSIPLITFFVLFCINSNRIHLFIEKTFLARGINNAAFRRLSKYTAFFNLNYENPIYYIGGNGLRVYGEFLPSYLLIIYYFGLIGLILVFLLGINMWKIKCYPQRIIIIIFAILMVGTELIMGNYILLYFPFCCYTYKLYIKDKNYDKDISNVFTTIS